jgi:hypothetical protein
MKTLLLIRKLVYPKRNVDPKETKCTPKRQDLSPEAQRASLYWQHVAVQMKQQMQEAAQPN